MHSGKLFTAIVGAVLIWAASPAVTRGQSDPGANRWLAANGEVSPPPSAAASPDAECAAAGCCLPSDCLRWTAGVDFIILDRIGSVNQPLVSTYPPHNPIIPGTGTERLDAGNLDQSFASGPRVDLIRRGDSGCDLEFSFFEIDTWNSAKSIAPNPSPLPNWLVFMAPGNFVQTTDYSYQSMGWEHAAKLANAELNVRWNPCPRVTVLAGFRWVELWEDLQGTIEPSDRTSPFWDTKTRNDLYGFQIGGGWKVWNGGGFSIDGALKAGIYDNTAEETTGVSIYREVYWESCAANRAAFLGEIDLQCKYQVTPRLAAKIGYEAMWLQGVALAPNQVQETYCHGDAAPIYVQARGIDGGSSVFFHGATVGLEFSF